MGALQNTNTFNMKDMKSSFLVENQKEALPRQDCVLAVTDVGCGAGLLSEPLARLGASVLGLDACEENVTAAAGHAALDGRLEGSVAYRCSTVEELVGTHAGRVRFKSEGSGFMSTAV